MQENVASAKSITTMQQYITKGGQINPAVAHSSSPQWDMDLVSTHRENGNTGRRAVDAGPVANNVEDEDDRESTLPPEYGDVFNRSGSPTVS
ncbi:MAG TPA: hypothetical protein VGO47_08490 [Chlamydiales bacterium]|nr:hypothetical protein [Chlamydiales bacterium]